MRVPHPLKQRLGRRVLLPVDEPSQVAGTGLLGSPACKPLKTTGTESTGCALGKARSNASGRTFFAAGQKAQACTNCSAFNSSGNTPQ